MDEESFISTKSHKSSSLKRYTVSEKLKILTEAKSIGNRSAARKYQVDERRIREWRKNEEKLKLTPKTKFRLSGGGRKLNNVEVEAQLLAYVEELRSRKLKVTHKLISREAARIWTELKEKDPSLPEFSASYGFVQRFCRRHEFVYRRRTTIAQKPPVDYIDKIVNFIRYVRSIRTKHDYQLSDIVACDETPIWFESIGESTVDKRGVKDVSLLTTGHSKLRCSVMLAAKADGTKLKPKVVLKRKRPLTDLEKKHTGIVFGYTHNGWFDEETTKGFLKKVLGSFSFRRRLLVWDAYRCHTMESMKNLMAQLKIDSAVIPGGCTKFIQAPDVCWNKPFKDRYGEHYQKWLIENDHQYTESGQMKAPPLTNIMDWIEDSWKSIPQDLIKKSFLTCGIVNDLYGCEDNLISCLKSDEMSIGLEKLKESNEVIDFEVEDEELDFLDIEDLPTDYRFVSDSESD